MADGTLSFEEFCKLPTEEERCNRYVELSDHDKFRARISMNPSAISPPCNICRYYFGFAKCEAFPGGISAEHISAVMQDKTIDCGNGFHFEKREDT